MKKSLFLLLLAASNAFPAAAPIPAPPTVPTTGYILIDQDSGRVLAAQRSDDRMEPASITKLMTAYIVFDALAGKQSELFREREMENAYLKALKRPENLIFVRDQGAAWDLFTIGTYRDLKHFAESAGILEADQEAAAKAAGFEAANRIGPYLRTLISSHHDTLAVSVK